MLIGILDNGNEYSLHHNIYLNNESTPSEADYYNQIKDNLSSFGGYSEGNADYDYKNEFIPYFKVRIWNLDNQLNKKIKYYFF